MTVSQNDLLAIERAAVRAWPAGETADIQGWHWRYSGGASQRANSVSTLQFTGANLTAAIDDAETRYRTYRVAPRFQVGDASSPTGLESALRARGYTSIESVNSLARALEPSAINATDGLEVAAAPSADWMGVYLAGTSEDRRTAAPAILARVPDVRGFILLRRNGIPVATALGVITDDVLIVECVMTALEARRAGAAHAVMRGVETWGTRKGARLTALQAVTTNAPAQALYAGLGYNELGRQHYFVLDR
jgi:N-acetylglutamate synthase